MRITEIVVETGFIDQFKSAVATNKQRGFDAVDRIVNPAKWGSNTKPATINSNVSIKDAVTRAANKQRIYNDDETALMAASKSVESGDIETKQDVRQLSQILKIAATGRGLSDPQRQVLSNFLKEI